jgi:hypothetical protein
MKMEKLMVLIEMQRKIGPINFNREFTGIKIQIEKNAHFPSPLWSLNPLFSEVM